MNLDDQLSLFSETDKVEQRIADRVSVTPSDDVVALAVTCSVQASKMAQVIKLVHARQVRVDTLPSDNDLLSRVLNRSRLF